MPQAEQKLGIHKKVTTAHVFIPGYTELTSSFLRLSLTTELALKRTYNIGYGPPRCEAGEGFWWWGGLLQATGHD